MFYQEGELSADLYTFHEAVSHLQEMEEDVLDSHKMMLDQLPKWHQSCATLLSMTNEVDYDVDGTHFSVFGPLSPPDLFAFRNS